MNAHAEKKHKFKSNSVSSDQSQISMNDAATFQFVNKRNEYFVQEELQEMANNSD
jgi:hypothetical protein